MADVTFLLFDHSSWCYERITAAIHKTGVPLYISTSHISHQHSNI